MERTLRAVNADEWRHRLATLDGRYKPAHRHAVALRRISASEPTQWLDIGAGNGYLASLVKQHHPDVHAVGVDFVAEALSTADALDERIEHDLNAAPLDLPDASQDYVTCLEVLEHVLFPAEVLKEIQRLLKPGRRALVSVPNLQFVEYVVQLARGKLPHPAADERHMSIFTVAHLRKLARKAGLTPIAAYGTDASPAFLGALCHRFFAKTILLEVEKAA